jgi:hypothetical protein
MSNVSVLDMAGTPVFFWFIPLCTINNFVVLENAINIAGFWFLARPCG